MRLYARERGNSNEHCVSKLSLIIRQLPDRIFFKTYSTFGGIKGEPTMIKASPFHLEERIDCSSQNDTKIYLSTETILA